MGASSSHLERQIGTEQFPNDEHYFGLVNFGNTCYSNSVLQALYFCQPFRHKVLEYRAKNRRPNKETLLSCLADLFYSIQTQKKKVGTIAPKKFISRLRKDKEEFDNYMQQDAHEFLNFLINKINEILVAEESAVDTTDCVTCDSLSALTVPPCVCTTANRTAAAHNGFTSSSMAHTCTSCALSARGRVCRDNACSTPGATAMPSSGQTVTTWVHEIFQGVLTSETKCLNCETVSSKDENFFDLQVDIDHNTSISHCLQRYSASEMLCGDNKFKCDVCSSYQEAQKCMRVKKPPTILALHLKRFKYMEQCSKHVKLSHRVVFPLEMRLFNVSQDVLSPDRLYTLISVVIHCGSGPNRGHYISIVKSKHFWLLFDDDVVDKIDSSSIEDFFGLTSDFQKSSETGYILFYQSNDK